VSAPIIARKPTQQHNGGFMRGNVGVALLVLAAMLLSACAGMQSRAVSSSYAFLYPKTNDQVEEPSMAVLKLPVRVGIAFVPETESHQAVSLWQGARTTSHFPEAHKHELLARIAAAFK